MANNAVAPVDLVNGALVIIGEDMVDSIDPSGDSEHNRIPAERYDTIRRVVLRSGFWNCAMARASLPQSSTAPAWGFSYAYTLPSDFIRLKRLEYTDTHFSLEGRRILTDESTCKIKYVKDLTDVSMMDDLLKEAIIARLAHDLAIPLKGDPALQSQLWTAYLSKIADAHHSDAMEAPIQQVSATTWDRANRTHSSRVFRPIEDATS